MSNVFEKILDGVKAVAPVAANLVVPGSGSLVEGLMRAVTDDGPETSIDAVAEKIAADPALMVQLQEKAMDHEAKLAEIEARKLESVGSLKAAGALPLP
jgi:hypothetical protein